MKIGVSSCLLGNMCRYDGAHSKDQFIVKTLQKKLSPPIIFLFQPLHVTMEIFTTKASL